MATLIDSLPSEILSRIFSSAACSCASARRTFYDAAPSITNPLLLSAVCKNWRIIALNNRFLWSHVDLSVNTKETEVGYPSPQLWVERSLGSPLHIHIQQYRLMEHDYSDEDNEDLDRLFGETAPPMTLMVRRLRKFITPLMPQVSSLTLSVTWPNENLLNLIVKCWRTSGTYGHAKVLRIYANAELSHLELRSSVLGGFFESLDVLHLHNAILSWPDSTLSGLTNLEIEMGEGHWAINEIELAATLASCPKLEHLSLNNLEIEKFPESNPTPAFLQNLKVLRVGHPYSGRMFESMLAVLKPGTNPLQMHAFISHIRKHMESALIGLRSFVQRSNVSTLHVHAHSTNGFAVPYFASQIGPLPRVKNLVLEYLYFYDKFRINRSMLGGSSDSDDDSEDSNMVTYTNPCSIDPHPPLWPQLQNLYLHHCYFDNDYTCRLLSAHPTQTLFLRNYHDDVKRYQRFDVGTASAEDYVQALSQVVPKVVRFENGLDDWPWSLE